MGPEHGNAVTPHSQPASGAEWLVGGGDAGELIRAADWSGTPLGPREGWPVSLRTVVNLVVGSSCPMALLWGRERLLIYNDAYRDIAADRRPQALGRPAREIWPEAWPINEPILRTVMDRGETVYVEDELFPINRHGRREEAYFTLCYSPVRAEDGSVAGSLVTLLETTRRVRQLQALNTERERAESDAQREREALREGEERYRTLFEKIDEGFCVVQVLCDPDGTAVDLRFLELNPAFERHTGLANVTGKTAREVVPSLEPSWFEAYGRVALTGTPERFEQRSSAMGRWWDVYAVRIGRPEDRKIALVVTDVTARKQAEETLRSGERQFRVLIENLYTGVALIDTTGRFTLYNARFLQLFELARNAAVNDVNAQDWSRWEVLDEAGRLLHADERPVRKAILTGKPVRNKLVGVRVPSRPNGDPVWMLISAAPLVGDGGRIEHVICTYHEVTDRRRAEEALRASEERYRELSERLRASEQRARVVAANIRDYLVLVESVHDAGGEVVDWRCIEANDASLRLFRTDRETLVGSTIRGLLPAHLAFVHDRMKQVLVTGRSETYETSFLDCTFLTTLFRVDERTVGSAALDITERKRAEETLRRREATLAQAGQMAHLGAWDIEVRDPGDLNSNPLTWSDEVYRIFGHEPGTIAVTNDLFFQCVHPEDRPLVGQAVVDAIAAKRPYSIEHRIVRPDGTERVVQEHAELMFDAAGTLVHIIGAVQDVTDRQRTEQALREADRRKNEFLALLSHELRNPLAPIRNSVYIMERAAPGGEQARRAMAVIERQVVHMARLIDDLLDVTRISRGKIRLQREPLELNDIVRGTGDDLRELFRRNGIEFEVAITERPLHAFVDRTRIAQVIGNLLQNAAKFTPAGGRVTLSLNGTDGEGVIAVRDSGVGLDAGVVKKLFEAFVQADTTLDRSKGGLGLGLALVKGLIELHGGTVSARSEGPGAGAEFVVRLPLEQADAPSSRPRDGEPGGGTRRALRVLLIEDNADAAASLKEALELNGHEVETAGTGQEAVERARGYRPDVVLCDIGLPGIDGYEVARRMRADAELCAVPLVALSGYAAPEDLDRSREAGFVHHLAKPPDPAALERTLSELLTARRSTRHERG